MTDEIWDFKIGNFQVVKKWLDARSKKGGKNPKSGRVLTNNELNHLTKIISIIAETLDISVKIDSVIKKYGGWPIRSSVNFNKSKTGGDTQKTLGGF